jgi:cytosine/adenosine deaminase-related metal-dependent hydrolase
MRKITADIIYDGRGGQLTDKVIILEDSGLILDVVSKEVVPDRDIEHFKGILTPGFINAHCHIELSHLKDQIPTGTGLIDFIKKVVTLRNFPPEVIQEKITAGIEEMERNGIVAVGDICNTTDSAAAKLDSGMRFYNFIEAFDLFQTNLEEQWVGFKAVFDGFKTKGSDRKAMVPHAPYSVSRELFVRINTVNQGGTVSIHNQETPDENTFARDGSGGLTDFYKDMGLPLDGYDPPGTSSLEYALTHLSGMDRVILVHNTMSGAQDVARAAEGPAEAYWCTCANANLYIENRLPDYRTLTKAGAKICVGTDSLSSNWKLSVWDEVKTIAKYKSSFALEELISWACQNGAEALGFDTYLGSIEKGKVPGINHIQVDPKHPVDSWPDDIQVIA